jgi:hypothetical protein
MFQGITFAGVLGIVFIVLKLTDNIDWSWWLVLLPFYWMVAIGVILMGTGAIILLMEKGIDWVERKFVK